MDLGEGGVGGRLQLGAAGAVQDDREPRPHGLLAPLEARQGAGIGLRGSRGEGPRHRFAGARQGSTGLAASARTSGSVGSILVNSIADTRQHAGKHHERHVEAAPEGIHQGAERHRRHEGPELTGHVHGASDGSRVTAADVEAHRPRHRQHAVHAEQAQREQRDRDATVVDHGRAEQAQGGRGEACRRDRASADAEPEAADEDVTERPPDDVAERPGHKREHRVIFISSAVNPRPVRRYVGIHEK